MKVINEFSKALLVLAMLFGCGKEPNFVDDGANLFSPEQTERIATFHRYLLTDHDIDYRVLTLNQETDINRYAGEQFEALQVGSASKGGRGLLLVLDIAGNKVRMEVSRALETVYPDAFVAYLEQRQMTPFFAAGRVADGILATTELIVTRAQHAQANQGWDDESWSRAATSGGGATAAARLHDAEEQADSDNNAREEGDGKANDPEATLQAYLQAMSARNGNPDLGIYSTETRDMLRQWVVTPAQMDNIVRAYRSCHAEAIRYNAEQTLAVIRYPVYERACAPWFFVREGDSWQLDLSGGQRSIRFSRDNSWHFDWRELGRHPYQFAFADWGFDNRGYPQRMRWNLTVASDKEGAVWVERIGAGSAAEAFGFQPKDRLLSWNGEPLHHHNQVIRAMNEAEPATPVSVVIIRDETTMTLEGVAPPHS